MREQFVVVAGSPRSGTSLLRTILKNTESLRVHATEPHYIFELSKRYGHTVTNVPEAVELLLAHDKFPGGDVDAARLRQAFAGTDKVSLSAFLRTAYRLMRGDSDIPLVLKHPTFILHLDLARTLFPDLAVIHCVRDPRANVLSQRTRWPATSLWIAATRWQACVEAGRRCQQQGAIPYLEVRYEDLVLSPEATCRTICGFLKIPFDPAMLTFDHVEREWNPTNPGEGAKRHYQGFEQQRIHKWKKYLTPSEVKLIEDCCHRGMALFGYEKTAPAVELGTYVPFYLRERRKALNKSIKRMKHRLRGGVVPAS